MISELNLQHTELSVFAMIYGFCRDGQGDFHGSRRYLAELCNCSLKSVDIALKKLLKKQMILKDAWFDQSNQKRCIYTVNYEKINELTEKATQENNYTRVCNNYPGVGNNYPGVGNNYAGVGNNYAGGTEKNTPNIIDINKSNKINNNITPSVDDGEVNIYGFYGNVRLSEYWYEYLQNASNYWCDEYIERLDSYIQKNKLNKQSAFWPPERFGITILDWMRRDGVFSD